MGKKYLGKNEDNLAPIVRKVDSADKKGSRSIISTITSCFWQIFFLLQIYAEGHHIYLHTFCSALPLLLHGLLRLVIKCVKCAPHDAVLSYAVVYVTCMQCIQYSDIRIGT